MSGPKLMLATATSKHYPKATIEIFGEGGGPNPPILTWELTERVPLGLRLRNRRGSAH